MKNNKYTYSKVIAVIFIILFVMVAVYGICGEIFLPKETSVNGGYCEDYMDEWYQVFEDGSRQKLDLPGRAKKDGEKVVIERTIGSDVREDAFVILRTSKQDFKVYIDDKLREEYSTEESRMWGQTSPVYYLFVKLHTDDAGKTIRIEATGIDKYLGTFYNFYYGNYSGYWTRILHEQGGTLAIGVFMIIISVFAFIVSLAIQIVYGKKQKLLSLSMGVLIVAFWIVFNSAFRQLLFPNISVIGDLTFLMVALMPVPIASYMNQLQKRRYNLLYHIAEGMAIIDAVVCISLYVTGAKDFVETFNMMAVVLFYLIIVMVVSMIVDLFKGYVRDYWIIAGTMALAAVAAVIQVLNYLHTDKVFDISTAGIALVLMLCAAIVDSVKDIATMENARQRAIFENETKSQFLANMSHEIRTPINAILGMNEMIMKESSEEGIVAYSKDVDESGKILLALVNDILDFSKIESGKMELLESKYDLKALIDRLYNMIKVRAIEKNLDINVQIEYGMPKLFYGDEAKLQQILTNLLTNAVKYTDKGFVTLAVDYEKVQEGYLLIFEVKDSGRGIKEEDIDNLFVTFQRMDEKKNSGIEGTGLGLAITKSYVELMGGNIEVSSQYGKGSSFVVTIPQQIVSDEIISNVDMVNNDNVADDTNTLYAPDVKLLVVDDVMMNLKVFVAFLKKTGIQVDTAENGQDAIRLWKEKKYDMVFLDHMMPGMDGIECARKMWAEDECNPDTPIVMLTANAVVGMKEQYEREGFSDYMTKPFTQNVLYNMIKKHIPAEKWSVKEWE